MGCIETKEGLIDIEDNERININMGCIETVSANMAGNFEKR